MGTPAFAIKYTAMSPNDIPTILGFTSYPFVEGRPAKDVMLPDVFMVAIPVYLGGF